MAIAKISSLIGDQCNCVCAFNNLFTEAEIEEFLIIVLAPHCADCMIIYTLS